MITAYFTAPDNSIIQESSIDPLGLEPIWTHYGQLIFENKITSVANDARAFTINAFHHYVVNRLLTEQDNLVNQTRTRFPKGWASKTDVKTGLLIFMENLMTFIFCMEKDNDASLETIGLLGLNKGNNLYRREGKETLLIASKTAGVLKNQINLGFTGRYKNPMMMMDFFTGTFDYPPDHSGTWARLKPLMVNWQALNKFANDLIALLVKDLLQFNLERRGRNTHPEIILRELMGRSQGQRWRLVKDGYLSIFGKNNLPVEMKEFWVTLLGFNKNAAGALYSMVNASSKEMPGYYEEVCRKAQESIQLQPAEANKIKTIIDIEPLLSNAEYLVRYLSHPYSKKVNENLDDFIQLRQAIDIAAKTIPDDAIPSLKALKKVMSNSASLEEWLNQIQQYHKKIMEKRGGQPWFDFDSQLNIRHFFSPTFMPGGSDMQVYLSDKPWLHTYYLDTLRNLKNGLA